MGSQSTKQNAGNPVNVCVCRVICDWKYVFFRVIDIFYCLLSVKTKVCCKLWYEELCSRNYFGTKNVETFARMISWQIVACTPENITKQRDI